MGADEASGRGFKAVALHPTQGTVAGELIIGSNGARFEGQGTAFELPGEGLHVESGGYNNQDLLLRHPEVASWTVSARDRLLARHLAEQFPNLRNQLAAAAAQKTSSSRLWVFGLSVVVFLLLAVVALFALKSMLARVATDQLPVAWEQKFGEAVLESVKAQSKFVEDPGFAAQIAAVSSRLTRSVTNSPYTFTFHVIEAKDLNAFAIPGGHIVVHTGLLEAADRPEELAGVLAHEMAHVTQRHSLRNMVEAAGLGLIIESFVGDASGLLALASGGSEFLLRQKFSRDTEREADDVGWDYLLAADIDPRGMIDFFARLQKEVERNAAASAADGSLNLLSTHPATPERIARLEAKWKSLARTNFTSLSPTNP